MKLTYIQQSGSPPIGDGGDQYTGLDRFGRVVDQRWMKVSSGADLERVQYGFDRASNRVWRKNAVAAGGQDEFYTYDGLKQLLTLQRGTLNSDKTGISGTPSWEEDLTFDPTGNWNNYVNQVNGTTTLSQPRTHNAVNEILTISGSSALMVQDGAGNMTKAPQVGDWGSANAMIYDGWNRLVKVLDGGTTVAVYGYDGQNRRVSKVTGTTTRHYYYSSRWQILEERLNTVTTADRQFVWGQMGVDNLVLRDRGTERLYSLQDVFNATAVTDTTGTVQERYGYNAFGLSRVMDASFNPLSASGYDWETRYASYRFDSEASFYQVRNRYLHPTLGRWLTRDPIEYLGGINLYAYVLNSPSNAIDFFGLKKCTCVSAQFMPPEGISAGFEKGTHVLSIGDSTPYSFTVKGDPSCCTCSFIDVSGTINFTFAGQAAPPQTFNNTVGKPPPSCDDKNNPDRPGDLINIPNPSGTQLYTAIYKNLKRKITCVGTDGSKADATTGPLNLTHSGSVTWSNYVVTAYT